MGEEESFALRMLLLCMHACRGIVDNNWGGPHQALLQVLIFSIFSQFYQDPDACAFFCTKGGKNVAVT